MVAAKAAESYADEWGVTWYLWQGMSTSIPLWIHLKNLKAAAEPTGLNKYISFYELSLRWSQRPQSEIIKGYLMKISIPYKIAGKSIEIKIPTLWSELPRQ